MILDPLTVMRLIEPLTPAETAAMQAFTGPEPSESDGVDAILAWMERVSAWLVWHEGKRHAQNRDRAAN